MSADAPGLTDVTDLTDLVATPGQTVGPFFGYALPFAGGNELVPPGSPGAIRLHGTVLDGAGAPVPDALLEIWQLDADGAVPREQGSLHRDGYTFTGFGRAATDDTGRYVFTTVAPGAGRDAAGDVAGDVAGRAPFIAMTVFARGLTNRLFTRVYPPADEALLAADPLLASVPADRRGTLVATADEHGLVFDVVLQGENETVFLTYPAS